MNALSLLANLVQPDTPAVNNTVSKLVGNYSMSQVCCRARNIIKKVLLGA